MTEGLRETPNEGEKVTIPARLADVYIYDREIMEERIGRSMTEEEEAEFAREWMSPEGEESAA